MSCHILKFFTIITKNKLYEVFGSGNYGNPDDSYELFAKGHHTETLSVVEIYKKGNSFILKGDDNSGLEFVIYQAQYDSEDFGKKAFWIRPKEMFLEKTTFEGEEVLRFEYVGKPQ